MTPFEALRTDQNTVSSAANVLWLPLGELLVDRGLLSKVQLNIALAQQKQSGKRLGEVLVDLGFVSEPALARTLLEQVGLTEQEPDPVDEPQLRPRPVVTPAADQPEPTASPISAVPVQPAAAVHEPVTAVRAPAPAPAVAPAPDSDPPIVDVDADADEREKWWMRSRDDARIAELESALVEFERRSREIESDIAHMRGVIAELRQTRL